jgi:cytochrome P450
MRATIAYPDIDFSQIETMGNQVIGKINALREIDSFFWSEPQQAWIISDHEAVAEGFRGHLPLSAARHNILKRFMPDPAERERRIGHLMRTLPYWLTNTDPPQQLRLRKLMLNAFSRKVAEAYRPYARQIVLETLDAIAGRSEVEFVDEVARQVPARVITKLLGFSDDYIPRAKRWAYLANKGLSGYPTVETMEEFNAAMIEMHAAFSEEIEKRRRHPTDDFVSALVTARDEHDQLTEDELQGTMNLTLLAGHDTTTNTIALSVAALSTDAKARDYMRRTPERTVESVMELQRFIAMSTSMSRIVIRDFEWRGHQLKEGQVVHLMIAGANRDPKVFAEPEVLDLSRPQEKNMTFGPGLHHCIGHFFAKMQLSEFFPEFLKRYDSFEVLDDDISFGGGISFRGPQELHVRLTPRTGITAAAAE